MKKYTILAFVCFLLTSIVSAQPNCSSKAKDDLNQGIAAYNNGNYPKAIGLFNAAAKCPTLSRKDQDDIKEWAKKCVKAKKDSRPKTPSTNGSTTSTPMVAMAKPEVSILFSGYIAADCIDGRRGAELNVIFEVKNMKGKKVRACCLIAPLDGNGKIRAGSDPEGKYTVQNSMSGQEQLFEVTDDEEYLSADFFVPFSVMDFYGNYAAQSLKSEIAIYPEGANKVLASLSQLYDNLETHTVAVRDHVDSCNIETTYLGGGIGWENFAACPGNKILFSNLPEWIREDSEGLHVLDNTSTEGRRASIFVTSTEGGNSVKVNIIQEGRAEGQKATALINDVWMEEKIYDSRDDIGILKIHVDCEVNGARGKEIRVYALFYKADGETPLLNSNGQIMFFNKSRATYAESRFDDFPLLTFYNRFTHAINNSMNAVTYYIGISEDGGESFITKKGPYTVTW